MNTVTRSFLRYMVRRRGLTFLQFLGIAFGVAATIGIFLSARAATAGFAGAVEFLRGNATHSLQRPAGPMDEKVLAGLMRDPAVDAFSPVIERSLKLANGETAKVLGIDPLLDRDLRPALARAAAADGGNAGWDAAIEFLLRDDAVLAESGLAQKLGAKPGRRRRIRTSLGEFEIIGVFPNPSGEPLLLLDISHVQTLYGLEGKIDRIDLILNDGPGFAARWEPEYRLRTSARQRETLTGMLRAFRLNLEAGSFLALFVGIFLIYNTAMFAVVSRKKDAGILRSLGARRSEIVAAFLTEILLLGAAGGAAGGLLGYALSRVLTAEVGGTVTNLYFFLRPAPPAWSFWIPAAGALLGAAAGLLGSLWPLRELLYLDPVRSLSGRTADRQSGAGAGKLALLGTAVILLSLLLLAVFPRQIYPGFAGAFGFLTGASFLTGLALVLIHPLLRRGFDRLAGLPGKLAAGNIRLNLGRTAVAVAAFMVALSMAIGLSAMIGSFRYSVSRWLANQVNGDIYISSMDESVVPLDLIESLRTLPGIAGLDPYRNVFVDYGGTSIFVSSVDAGLLQKFSNFAFLAGGRENWDKVRAGGVIVSESFARRFGIRAGDAITIDGVRGPVRLSVAEVFYDYTSEHGVVMMDRSLYLKLFEDPTVDSLGVFVDPRNPRRAEVLADVVRRAGERGLAALSRDTLHANALRVFDSTFSVTLAMRLLALVVAFFGIAGAILTLFLERRREFGIYRALGFSAGQVSAITLLEGLAMGIASFLLSVGVGTAMAALLIKVINLRSFNWTIFVHLSGSPYLLAAATAALAGLGAAVYPIIKARRTYPQMQIGEE